MSRGAFSPQEALCLGPGYPDTLLNLGCPGILSPHLSGEPAPQPGSVWVGRPLPSPRPPSVWGT